MASVNIYKIKGATSKLVLPAELVGEENLPLLAQAVRVYRNRISTRRPIVKTRAEVNKSTRKIYRQKGTGRARHGALSAPLFVGGGKAHGPRGVRRILILPKKMKKKALKVAIGMKVKQKMVVGVDFVGVKNTKSALTLIQVALKGIEQEGANAMLAVSNKNIEVKRYFRNLPRVRVVSYQDLNAYWVYNSKVLILDKDVFGKTKSQEK